ncbi:heterokaryon incompatibility protein-domain-containing protein [Nemania sp. FL0031]|nr:heterokaryon incompatibility protein-domain-containing protein [Nemania sp. FL0031]
MPHPLPPHSCQHCEHMIIDCTTAGTHDVIQGPASRNLIWDELIFDVTFQALLAASSDGCQLCRWILNAKAISRQRLRASPELLDHGHPIESSDLKILAHEDDADPGCLRPSLLEAVHSQSSEVQDYILVAATEPSFVLGLGDEGVQRDLHSLRYFGLYDPRTNLTLYRTVSGLQIFTTEQDPAAEVISTRPMQNEPSQCLDAISSWLQNCLENHTSCRYPVSSLREANRRAVPKRLVRIKKLEGQQLRLSLQDTDSINELPPFAALSYCWGGAQTFACTQSNSLELASNIPDDRLPATIQDAVTVCSRLSLDYLWVDSICILQDSEMDKAIEIAKIPYIYGGAAVTIAASRARSAWDGFLNSRAPSLESVPVFQLPWRSAKSQLGTVMLMPLDAYPEPIDRRGWTLQEQLLSTRIVEFGTRQTRCTCRDNLSHSNSPAGYVDGWRIERDVTSSYIYDRTWNMIKENLQDGWNQVVRRYTERKLTFGTDRPLAISGIAERCNSLCGDEYFAGLWKHSINVGLLWAVMAIHRRPRPSKYQGPTWSWLAVNSVVFNLQENQNKWNSEQFNAEVVSIRRDPVSAQAPFGAIRKESGQLRIRGRLARATYHRDSLQGGDFKRASDHSLEITTSYGVMIAPLFLDCIEDALEDELEDEQSINGNRPAMVLEVSSTTAGPSWFTFGLVLRPTAENSVLSFDNTREGDIATFTRIGVFEYGTSLVDFKNRSATNDAGWGERTERELNFFRDVKPLVLEIV